MQFIEQPNAQLELGYWGIRGLAQPIRFLLTMADVPFNEVRLGLTQTGEIIEDEDPDWQSQRAKLDMPFPNLPYLIDSRSETNKSLSQSNAILRYLARQFDFYGSHEAERIEIDILQEEAYDFRNKIVRTAYTLGDDYAAAYTEFSDNAVPRHLDGFERYLEANKSTDYFVGTHYSLVDFVLYELIWQTSLMVPGTITLDYRPHLFKFLQAFENNPKISEYMKSNDYPERPINSPWASFT